MSKILLMDFDGVIHAYTSGWQGATTISDPPVPEAFEFLRAAIKSGFDVQIYSARSSQEGGIAAMQHWFLEHGWPRRMYTFEPEILSFPTQKPPAWLTIDDRCVQFNGVFPKLEDLHDFKPWYKQDWDGEPE